MPIKIIFALLTLLLWRQPAANPSAAMPPLAPEPVVNAILFYSPNCGHCHYVITEVLPPLFQKYDQRLNVIGIDVTNPDGQTLFMNTLQYFQVDSEGVPLLIVGDTYLIGSGEIPERFPGLIDRYLAEGGVAFPPIPGLAEALASAPVEQAPAQTQPAAESPAAQAPAAAQTPTAAEAVAAAPGAPSPTQGVVLIGDQTNRLGANFSRDLVGNSLAVVVLIGMVVSLGAAAINFRRTPAAAKRRDGGGARTVSPVIPSRRVNAIIPVLCILGLGVAGYLAFVETTQTQAVCGPVGDCNTVQQSPYATLFGILPIGVLGVVGYVLLLAAWWVGNHQPGRLGDMAWAALLLMTAGGVAFSIYLTFLEPFVIGATCAWCLTSAILMTVLFWLALAPGKAALVRLTKDRAP